MPDHSLNALFQLNQAGKAEHAANELSEATKYLEKLKRDVANLSERLDRIEQARVLTEDAEELERLLLKIREELRQGVPSE